MSIRDWLDVDEHELDQADATDDAICRELDRLTAQGPLVWSTSGAVFRGRVAEDELLDEREAA